MTALGKLAGRWNQNNKENRKIEELPPEPANPSWHSGLNKNETKIINSLSKETIDALITLVLLRRVGEIDLNKDTVGHWSPPPEYHDIEALTKLNIIAAIARLSQYQINDLPILKGD